MAPENKYTDDELSRIFFGEECNLGEALILVFLFV